MAAVPPSSPRASRTPRWIAGGTAAGAAWTTLLLWYGSDAGVDAAPRLVAAAESLRVARPRVGLFHVRGIEKYGEELRFLTSECGLVDTCGVIYAPTAPPSRRGEDSFQHLFGPWWHWYQSW